MFDPLPLGWWTLSLAMIAALLTKINGHFVPDQSWTKVRLTLREALRRFRPVYEAPESFAIARARPSRPEPATAQPGAVCFHCGEANPEPGRWRAVCGGALHDFCCAGCLGIAQAIHVAGLGAFYERRTDVSVSRPEVPGAADEWLRYDDPVLQSAFVRSTRDGMREVSMLLEGIHCGACIWLIEQCRARRPGIRLAEVNFATRRAHVIFDPAAMRVSDVLHAIAAIGYRAWPYDPARREAALRRGARAPLLRTAIALLAMMQVMMFALPTYVTIEGVEPEHRLLLEWARLTLTLPALLYSAAPFFRGAWRDLRMLRLGMDVPVALGLAAAFAASAASTFSGGGPVYYDSVTMFIE